MFIYNHQDDKQTINWKGTFLSTLFPKEWDTLNHYKVLEKENELLYQADKVTVVDVSRLVIRDEHITVDGVLVIKGIDFSFNHNTIHINSNNQTAIHILAAKHAVIHDNTVYHAGMAVN